MGRVVSFPVYAEQFERFMPGCADHKIGTTIPWRGENGRVRGQAKVLGVEYPEGGQMMLLTIEVLDG